MSKPKLYKESKDLERARAAMSKMETVTVNLTALNLNTLRRRYLKRIGKDPRGECLFNSNGELSNETIVSLALFEVVALEVKEIAKKYGLKPFKVKISQPKGKSSPKRSRVRKS